MPQAPTLQQPQAAARFRRGDSAFRPRKAPAPKRGRWRSLLALTAFLAFLWFAIQFGYISFGPNFHVVLPGRVYRSSQLGEAELRLAHARYGLKTIINLRGYCPELDWHQEEAATAKSCGMTMIDIDLSTSMPPHREKLRKLAIALEEAPEPLLIHCRQGADRTSLIAALALLLKTDATVAAAREQLSWRYAHSPVGKVQILDRALDDYEDWLAEQREAHSSARLRRWIQNDYLPGPCWATIEPISVPEAIRAGEWTTARVRVTNRGRRPGQFRQASHVGFHLNFHVTPAGGGKRWTHCKAGLFDRELKPGESLLFDLAIPPIRETGSCVLKVDMDDEAWCLFEMVGSPPLVKELVVLPWPMHPPGR